MTYLQTKNPNLGKFWRDLYVNGRCWSILWPFGLFFSNLVYLVAIWYILWLFGIYPLFWYNVTSKKNLATLIKIAKKPPTMADPKKRKCYVYV
jgi:hypothetical protein